MTELSHETFDFAEAIAGVNFPEVDAEVYFDEAIGFSIYEAQKLIHETEVRSDNKEDLRKVYDQIDALKKRAAASRYLITVRGLPASTLQVIDTQAEEAHPTPQGLIPGMGADNPEKDRMVGELVWKHSIVKITNPAGAVALPTEENIKQLREKTGLTVFHAINEAISELRSGTKSGFEQAAQDTSFLSDASTEG